MHIFPTGNASVVHNIHVLDTPFQTSLGGSDNYLTFDLTILVSVLAMLAWTANGTSFPEIYA